MGKLSVAYTQNIHAKAQFLGLDFQVHTHKRLLIISTLVF